MTTASDTAWVTELWQRVRYHAVVDAAELERRVVAYTYTAGDHASRDVATEIAHRLAGSLGSYGVSEGSRLAVAIQRRLHGVDDLPGEHDGPAAVALAAQLRRAIDSS